MATSAKDSAPRVFLVASSTPQQTVSRETFMNQLVGTYDAELEAAALRLRQSWYDTSSAVSPDATDAYLRARSDLNFVPAPESIQRIISMPRQVAPSQRPVKHIVKHLLQCGYTYETLRASGFTLATLIQQRFLISDLIELGATYQSLAQHGLATALAALTFDEKFRALSQLVRTTVVSFKQKLTLEMLRRDLLISNQGEPNANTELLSLGPETLLLLGVTCDRLVNVEKITTKQMTATKHLYTLQHWLKLGLNSHNYVVLEIDKIGPSSLNWSMDELRKAEIVK